jgi:hypothetical protein
MRFIFRVWRDGFREGLSYGVQTERQAQLREKVTIQLRRKICWLRDHEYICKLRGHCRSWL